MTKTFKEKLLELQGQIEAIKRDSENPYFKSKYFDINSLLAEIKPKLTAERLILTQGLTNLGDKLALETKIADVDSDDKLVYTCILPETTDSQKAGSAITYFRRYSLQSLLALEAEDDDANTASDKVKGKVNEDEPF